MPFIPRISAYRWVSKLRESDLKRALRKHSKKKGKKKDGV